MQHFPIFLSLRDRRVLLSGGGEAALAKLRLLLKTEARIEVFSPAPAQGIEAWAAAGKLALHRRALRPADLPGAALVYAADEDEALDARTADLAHAAGVLLNVVDDLHASDFITPAIVDRDPVTVAIGTEGAAPVLARAIKADLEERLPARLGVLARIGKGFRHAVEVLPEGRKRRDYWREFYFGKGPEALAQRGEDGVRDALETLLDEAATLRPAEGRVDLVGAGPGDPELLTLKARRALDRADVVLHDRLVPAAILELARREAILVETGKTGFGPAMPQEEIDALMIAHARDGHHVVRLKSGDPSVFGRLDEEIEALEAAGIPHAVIPGITSASAAAASLGRSLTRRGRNSALRFITGHDTEGFADHDWAALARPGAVTAIYMGKRAARFLQGRLLMHGADPAMPVSIAENVSRPEARTTATTLAQLAAALDDVTDGPALLFLGLAPRDAEARRTLLKEFA